MGARARVLLSLGLATVLLVVCAENALGAAISPGSIEAEGVLRGREISRSLTVFNEQDKDIRYKFEVQEKPLATWVEVHSREETGSIDELVVPAKGSASVDVIIRVPATAANGRYKGILRMVPQVTDGAKLIPGLAIDVSVVDKERIDLTLSGLSVPDVEEGSPLDINVGVKNDGNVDILPLVTVAIVEGEKILRQAEFQMETVGVGQTGLDIFNLSLKTLPVGEYRVFGVASFHGENSEQVEGAFKVVPPGTFTKATIESFEVQGAKRIGNTVKLIGRFSSKSPKPLEPKLVADVYLDGLKIGSVESKPQIVDPYRETDFEVPLRLRSSGEYRIEGYFTYSGVESNRQEVSFKVQGYVMFIAAALAVMVTTGAGAAYARGRKRRSTPHVVVQDGTTQPEVRMAETAAAPDALEDDA